MLEPANEPPGLAPLVEFFTLVGGTRGGMVFAELKSVQLDVYYRAESPSSVDFRPQCHLGTYLHPII